MGSENLALHQLLQSVLAEKIICPCCKKEVAVSQTPIPDYYLGWYLGKNRVILTEIEIRGLQQAITEHFAQIHLKSFTEKLNHLEQWACNNCIAKKEKNALRAELGVEKCGMRGPILVYLDLEYLCKDCGVKFVFSSQEQQYWYEELKFFNESKPIRCSECRRKNRQNHRLAELLALENKDLKILREIHQIYLEKGSFEKANRYAKMIKNVKNEGIEHNG